MSELIWIKGAGDLGTGVAYRLLQAGFAVVMTEVAAPLCVRRAVSFAEAAVGRRQTVEGYTAVPAHSLTEVRRALRLEEIPVLVDPAGELARQLSPLALVDAIMAKRNLGTRLADAPVVVALGPGFTAGVDAHAVIETQRGHWLGRALYSGAAAPDTGEPGEVQGIGAPRVVRAPVTGQFRGLVEIGALVEPGAVVGEIAPDRGDPVPVRAAIGGVLRGLIRTGVRVTVGLKIGDVDPSGEVLRCHTISDKALAIGGGVLEAILHLTGGFRRPLS